MKCVSILAIRTYDSSPTEGCDTFPNHIILVDGNDFLVGQDFERLLGNSGELDRVEWQFASNTIDLT